MKRNYFPIVVLTLSFVLTASFLQPANAEQKTDEKLMKTSTGFNIHATPPAGVEDVYDFYKKNFHMVPNVTQVMADSPALLRSYSDTQKNIKMHGKLKPAEINVVQMVISVENECRYCVSGHTMVGKMFYKTPDKVMNEVRSGMEITDPKLNALRTFTIAVYSNHGQVSSKELDTFLAAGYTRAHALDVVACIAVKIMSNYTNALADTEIDQPFKPFAAGLKFSGKK